MTAAERPIDLLADRLIAELAKGGYRITPINAWQPMDTAPKDRSRFWGKVKGDAISMEWHPGFEAFVSEWRVMTMENGYTFEDGSTSQEHSPRIYTPEAWMPIPAPPDSEPTP
jgi:hypothetical protein